MSDYKVVLALTNNENLNDWIGLAVGLLPDSGGEVHIHGMVTVEAEKSLSEGAIPARAWREAFAQAALEHPSVADDVHIHVDYQPFTRVMDAIIQDDVDLLLAQWKAPGELIGGVSAEDVFQQVPCDVVLVSGDKWQIRGDVLLSLRGGPNISLGIRVAQALAGDCDITLFHAADRRRIAPDLELMMRAIPQITRTVSAVTDIVEGISREASTHKVIVMGASFRKPEKDNPQGNPVILDVHERTKLPVVLLRGAQQEQLEFHVPNLLLVEETLSNRVDRWFAENTFHSDEFSDLHGLLALKERQGVTISLALPALNEEETVGNVIDTLKKALMDEVPLVDEIVLVDSDSDDQTVAIAQARGIPTYIHQEILADEVGAVNGKGEALWKSLYVTKGDIVAWVDTDITNIHPRFVYGLLGPLLKHPRIQYVKGFYARPIMTEVGKLQAYGGGRVTELVARPLLNLFYPELSGIVQPLSGEYAGRRVALEQVPFFSGYGVETGLLIDLLAVYGLEGIAQSDLEVRVHHNQPLVSLSKMSFAILQVFIARIESRYGVQLLHEGSRSMKLVVQEPERFALDIVEIGDTERPPMATVEAYREKYALVE